MWDAIARARRAASFRQHSLEREGDTASRIRSSRRRTRSTTAPPSRRRRATVLPTAFASSRKLGSWPFHFWRSLVEKMGYKVSEIPNTWDAFLDFFMPVQDKLREQGMRNIYAYGYQLAGNGGDSIVTFNQFMIAYGGKH